MKTRMTRLSTRLLAAALFAACFAFASTVYAQSAETPPPPAPAPAEQTAEPQAEPVTPQTDEAPQDAPAEAAQETPDIIAALEAEGRYTVLVDALKRTGMDQVLTAGGTYTLFAPTDDAFAKLPAGTLDAMDDAALAALLRSHLVVGTTSLEQAAEVGAVKTAEDATIQVAQTDGAVTVNDAAVVLADQRASNGLVHGIDTVLTPAVGAGPAEAGAGEGEGAGESESPEGM